MARCWILALLALGYLAVAAHADSCPIPTATASGATLFSAPIQGSDKQGGDILTNCGAAAGGVTPLWPYIGACCAFNTAADAYAYASALCITNVTPECAGFSLYPTGGKWWACLKNGVADTAVCSSTCFYNSATYPAYTCPTVQNYVSSVNSDNVGATLGPCLHDIDPAQLTTTLVSLCASTPGCVAFSLYPDDGTGPSQLGAGNWWGCLKSAPAAASAGSNYHCYYTPCAGISRGGYCWIYGETPANCTTTCAAKGRTCSEDGFAWYLNQPAADAHQLAIQQLSLMYAGTAIIQGTAYNCTYHGTNSQSAYNSITPYMSLYVANSSSTVGWCWYLSGGTGTCAGINSQQPNSDGLARLCPCV